MLTVPVKASRSLTIAETPIADNTWQRKHLQTIRLHYGKAAYAGWVDEGLSQILARRWEYLADLNIEVTDWLFDRLGIGVERLRASELGVSGAKQDLIVDVCSSVGADRYLSGQGAKTYQSSAAFAEKGVELVYQQYANPAYLQCQPRVGFVPDLSALDLVLNTGAEARAIMMSGMSLPAAAGTP